MRLTRSIGPLLVTALLVLAATPSVAATGDLDPTFGGDGVSVAKFRDGGSGLAVALDPEGRLVVAGRGGSRFALARFLPNGELDPTFGGDGKVKIAGRTSLIDIAILPDGRIVGVGVGNDGWNVCRITSAGVLDQSFGTGGIAELAYDAGYSNAVAIDASGRILVAGSYSSDAAVARYLPGGTLDPSFDGDGRRLLRLGSPDPGYDELADVATTADGGLVATGQVNGDQLGVVRLDEDGSLTNTFGDGGSVVTSFTHYDQGEAVVVQGDRILIGALLDYAMTVLAYDLDGAPDPGYGGGDGMTTIDARSFYMDMTTDPEGRAVVVGADRDIAVARLDDGGDPDGSFGDGGLVTVPLRYVEQARGVVVRPEGQIVVGGNRYVRGSGYRMLAVQLQA
jgi:uncharacterized delta-60 repeat protein